MWKPIETAPKDKSVLLYCRGFVPIYCGRQRYGNLGEPQQGEFAWRCDSSGRFTSPTHWMELPTPPLPAQDWKKEPAYVPPLVEWAKGLQSNAERVPDNAMYRANPAL